VMTRSRAWSLAAWSAVGLAGIHAALFSPDYLSYINFPRHKPHLAISDSNIDWGQSLKQVRAWIDARPADGRSISLYRFGKDEGSIRYYLGDRVTTIRDGDDPPTRGLLIISGVLEASPYDLRDVYRTLWPYQPEAVIGHCMFVYDLDKLGGGAPFKWKYPNLPKSGVSIQVHVGHGAPQLPKIAPMVPVGSRSVKASIPAAIPGVRTIVPAAIPNVRTPLPASVLGVTSSVSAKLPGVNMSVPNTPQNNRGNQPRSGNDGR
jgi:hypothetical protein